MKGEFFYLSLSGWAKLSILNGLFWTVTKPNATYFTGAVKWSACMLKSAYLVAAFELACSCGHDPKKPDMKIEGLGMTCLVPIMLHNGYTMDYKDEALLV